MWVRNVVCSVVVLAAVWALASGWQSIASLVGATQSFGGVAILWGLVAIFGACCYLIAKAVDARAGRQPGRQD